MTGFLELIIGLYKDNTKTDKWPTKSTQKWVEIENMVFASDPVKTLYLETFAEKFDSQNKFYINMIIWSLIGGKYNEVKLHWY